MFGINKILFTIVILCTLHHLKSKYTLQIYGDIGQNTEFLANEGTIINDSNLFLYDKATDECKKLEGEWKGVENLNNILQTDTQNSNFICNSNEIVVLGDNNYIETGKVQYITKDNPNYPAWINRIMCNFSLIRKALENVQCPKDTFNPLQYKDSFNRFSKLNLLLGNHSFDVDYVVESQESLNIATYYGYPFTTDTPPKDIFLEQRNINSDEFINFPVMQTRINDDTRVEFLDLNILNIYCYLFDNPQRTEEKYNNCFFKHSQYGIFPSFSNSETYTKRFILAINSFTPISNWRVIRLHHPIFNIAGFPGEQSFLWREKIDSNGNTLLDLIKLNNVNIILAGHTHNSQILSFPWSQLSHTKDVYSKLQPPITIGLNGKVVDLNLVTCPDSGCINRPKCYFNNKLLGNNTENTSCDEKSKMVFPHNNKTPSNLIVVVVGNGKIEDALENDQKSSAALLWARAITIGGSQLTFEKDKLKVQNFEGNSVFTFETESTTDDYLPILNDYVKFKLNGDNISKTEPNKILPFEYPHYSTINENEKEIRFIGFLQEMN